MDFLLYIQCFFVAAIGWGLQTSLKIRSMQTKAKACHYEFKIVDYFKKDFTSIAVSLLTILLFLFIVDELVQFNESIFNYVKLFFSFVGYASSDIASRLFSVVNKKINNAIGEKQNENK